MVNERVNIPVGTRPPDVMVGDKVTITLSGRVRSVGLNGLYYDKDDDKTIFLSVSDVYVSEIKKGKPKTIEEGSKMAWGKIISMKDKNKDKPESQRNVSDAK